MTTKEIGAWGERQAAEYLEVQGYFILEKNYSSKTGEIDLILSDSEDTYIFVEVKTRRNEVFGTPGEAVDAKKQQKIRRTALSFLQGRPAAMRFDVVEVLYFPGDMPEKKELRHIKNAF